MAKEFETVSADNAGELWLISTSADLFVEMRAHQEIRSRGPRFCTIEDDRG